MAVTELEIVDGPHYHAWALMPSMHTFVTTGRTMTQLVYVASKTPHVEKKTAYRHARKMAIPEMGKAGFMTLKCGGGQSCPYTFEPWEPSFMKVQHPDEREGNKED